MENDTDFGVKKNRVNVDLYSSSREKDQLEVMVGLLTLGKEISGLLNSRGINDRKSNVISVPITAARTVPD